MAIPVAFVAAMVATNVAPVIGWDRSLDAFRAEVIQTQGVADAVDVLPSGRRNVLWGWTSQLAVADRKARPGAGGNLGRSRTRPCPVPFAPHDAHAQLDDAYTWRR